MKSPMLAATLNNLADVRYPVLASPKFDGVRCLIINGVAMSRKFKPIPNKYVQAVLGSVPHELNGLDGELVVGSPTAPDCFRATTQGVMSVEGAPQFTFYVFDDFEFAFEIPYLSRLKGLKRRMSGLVLPVKHTMIKNEAELLEYEQEQLAVGYEGVILRGLGGFYKEGRSTVREGGMLKLKRFEDSEAVIIDSIELMHNANDKELGRGGKMERSHKKAGMVGLDKLGSLHVRDIKSGVEFDLGTGFTSAERAELWDRKHELPGLLVKYKFFPVGVKDKPRFPTFLGFRDPRDLGGD